MHTHTCMFICTYKCAFACRCVYIKISKKSKGQVFCAKVKMPMKMPASHIRVPGFELLLGYPF